MFLLYISFVASDEITITWKYGMSPYVGKIGTKDSVLFSWKGDSHNVYMCLDNQKPCDCTKQLSVMGPFIWNATKAGTFNFMCDKKDHCAKGNMKAQITVA